jgi:PIN domain nuclease of toxin-antitoxin system
VFNSLPAHFLPFDRRPANAEISATNDVGKRNWFGNVGLRSLALSVILDTHVWLWWLLGQPDLPATERTALDTIALGEPPLLPAICLWEAQMLHAKGRLTVKLPFDRWLMEAAQSAVVRIAPLDVQVVLAVNDLPLSFHGESRGTKWPVRRGSVREFEGAQRLRGRSHPPIERDQHARRVGGRKGEVQCVCRSQRNASTESEQEALRLAVNARGQLGMAKLATCTISQDPLVESLRMHRGEVAFTRAPGNSGGQLGHG